MSIHPNLSRGFVALPTRRKSSFALVVSRIREPSPRVRAFILESLDVLANAVALSAFLAFVAMLAK